MYLKNVVNYIHICPRGCRMSSGGRVLARGAINIMGPFQGQNWSIKWKTWKYRRSHFMWRALYICFFVVESCGILYQAVCSISYYASVSLGLSENRNVCNVTIPWEREKYMNLRRWAESSEIDFLDRPWCFIGFGIFVKSNLLQIRAEHRRVELRCAVNRCRVITHCAEGGRFIHLYIMSLLISCIKGAQSWDFLWSFFA
jgi:hypothetical protein